MVIVVRSDLKNQKGEKIRSGKIAAQVAHAASAFLIKKIKNNQKIKLTTEEIHWMENGTTKICLQATSEQQLLEIFNKSKDLKLEVNLITDAGRTEFNGIPTKTCLAIGPDDSTKIDRITGDLSIL